MVLSPKLRKLHLLGSAPISSESPVTILIYLVSSTPPAQTICREPDVATITVFEAQPTHTVWEVQEVTFREQATVWVGYVLFLTLVPSGLHSTWFYPLLSHRISLSPLVLNLCHLIQSPVSGILIYLPRPSIYAFRLPIYPLSTSRFCSLPALQSKLPLSGRLLTGHDTIDQLSTRRIQITDPRRPVGRMADTTVSSTPLILFCLHVMFLYISSQGGKESEVAGR